MAICICEMGDFALEFVQSLRHGCAAPPFHSSTWSPRFVRKAHLRCSLFHWGLRTGLRFAGPVFRGCGALRAVPQFSMVVPLRSQARLRHSLLHWAYYGLFRALRAASVRPSPLHPFGASTTTACFAHCARPSCAPFESLRRGCAAPPPFGSKGRLLGSAAPCGVPLSKRLPLIPRGAVGEAD